MGRFGVHFSNSYETQYERIISQQAGVKGTLTAESRQEINSNVREIKAALDDAKDKIKRVMDSPLMRGTAPRKSVKEAAELVKAPTVSRQPTKREPLPTREEQRQPTRVDSTKRVEPKVSAKVEQQPSKQQPAKPIRQPAKLETKSKQIFVKEPPEVEKEVPADVAPNVDVSESPLASAKRESQPATSKPPVQTSATDSNRVKIRNWDLLKSRTPVTEVKKEQSPEKTIAERVKVEDRKSSPLAPQSSSTPKKDETKDEIDSKKLPIPPKPPVQTQVRTRSAERKVEPEPEEPPPELPPYGNPPAPDVPHLSESVIHGASVKVEPNVAPPVTHYEEYLSKKKSQSLTSSEPSGNVRSAPPLSPTAGMAGYPPPNTQGDRATERGGVTSTLRGPDASPEDKEKASKVYEAAPLNAKPSETVRHSSTLKIPRESSEEAEPAAESEPTVTSAEPSRRQSKVSDTASAEPPVAPPLDLEAYAKSTPTGNPAPKSDLLSEMKNVQLTDAKKRILPDKPEDVLSVLASGLRNKGDIGTFHSPVKDVPAESTPSEDKPQGSSKSPPPGPKRFTPPPAKTGEEDFNFMGKDLKDRFKGFSSKEKVEDEDFDTQDKKPPRPGNN